MKKSISLLLILSLYSCIRDDDGTNNRLPAITAEGKKTFGCTIDGETFLPRSNGGFSPGSTPVLRVKYNYFESDYYGYGPGYVLAIRASNSFTDKDVYIELNRGDEPLMAGQTYPLVLKTDGAIGATYGFATNTPDPNSPDIFYYDYFEHVTTNEYVGEITFSRVDETNKIISGEFYFTCINASNGTTAEIRDGRFDLVYESNF